MADLIVDYSLIIKAITDRLKQFYPDETFNIYDNRVVGDMETPCFVIHLIQPQAIKIRKNRYRYIYTMDVRYYSNENANLIESDMNKIAVEMLEVLSEVRIEDVLLKLENDRVYCEKEENVLHCFANYIHEASQITEELTAMDKLNLGAGLKED